MNFQVPEKYVRDLIVMRSRNCLLPKVHPSTLEAGLLLVKHKVKKLPPQMQA